MDDNFQQKDNFLLRIKLLAEQEEGSITALEQKINASKSVISRAINKGTDIQSKWILAIAENYPSYSMQWLLTGKGKPKMEDNYHLSGVNDETAPNITRIHNPKSVEKKHEKQAVNLYDFKASAGLRELFDNRQADIIDTISIPNMPKCDGAIHVSGDSMIPVLKSGDIVLYKEFRLSYDSIIFGEMYLLSYTLDESTYLTVVKYVRKSPKGEDYITLASENPNHADKDIEFRRINAIALVQASIRINTMM